MTFQAYLDSIRTKTGKMPVPLKTIWRLVSGHEGQFVGRLAEGRV